MTDHSTLERRLHDASDPALWDDVSPDAWQQNERRLAADRSHRAGQRLRVVAAAAAVVVVVGGGVLVMSQLNGSSPPNSSGGTKDGASKDAGSKDQDPFKPDNLVGKVVVLERFRANGAPVEHSAFLTRAGGKGLSLCDLYKGPDTVSSSAGSGSCTASSPDPAEPKTNAFRFVTGTEGSDDLKGVTGAVEPRVASLRAWVGDSAVSRPVPLHALGVKGLQAFGITTPGARAPVVRIVAYGDDGAVLQILDIPGYIGEEWLPDDDTCSKTTPAPTTGDATALGPVENIEFATSSVWLHGTDGPADICVPAPKREPLSSQREGQFVVVVTGPEVTELRYKVAGQPRQTAAPMRFPGTAWGVVVIRTDSPSETVTLDGRSAGGKVIGPMAYYRIPTD